jgi:hypothetical protein
MKNSNNVRRSERLHRIATELLASCGLVPILEKYGAVRPLGPYPANLMSRGDIDFHVIRPQGYTMRDIVEVYTELALSGRFEQQMIWNWDRKARRPEWKQSDGLSGYYIFLRTRYQEMTWKLDIWFVETAEQAKEDKRFNILNQTVTAEQREAILAFKEIRDDAEADFCSQKIYELVLLKGVTSPAEFIEILKKEAAKK